MAIANLELVEAHEHAAQLHPTRESRAWLFGEWPRVLEALCSNGKDCDELAHELARVSLVTLNPITLGAMVSKLGWTTVRRRRGNERVRVLAAAPKDHKC